MAIEVGDILRIVASMAWPDGEINQNVYNAIIGGTGGPFDDLDIVDDAVDWMETIYTELVGELSADLDSTQVQVYVWDSVGEDWDEVGTDVWTFNPTDVMDPLPRGVAALVNARTTNPDVSGKKYFPGLTEGSIGSGLLNAPFVTAALDAAVEWAAPFAGLVTAASWIPGVWSPTTQALLAMSGALSMQNIAAYQRRRKRGVGV